MKLLAVVCATSQTTKQKGKVRAISKLHLITAALLLDCALGAQATPISIQFDAVITQFKFKGADPGMASGNPFQVTLTYDDATPDSQPGSVELGRYEGTVSPAMTITSGDSWFTMSALGLHLWAYNDTEDIFRAGWDVDDAHITTSWSSNLRGSANIILRDGTGIALDSDILPTNFTLSDWITERSFYVAGWNGLGGFEMTADITSARRVPETLPTGFALAGVTLLLGFVKRRC